MLDYFLIQNFLWQSDYRSPNRSLVLLLTSFVVEKLQKITV